MNQPARRAASFAKMAVALGIIVGLVGVGLVVRWPMEQPFGYWAIDDSTMGIVVLDSPDLKCDIASVNESSDAVHIHAQCGERVIPVPQTGVAQQYVMQVTLEAPLAGRMVYDGSGRLAQLCQNPAPDCWYSG